MFLKVLNRAAFFSPPSRVAHVCFICNVHVYSVTQLCLTLCDPIDCRPPGSSVHGVFQARILEWAAISYSIICNIQGF